MTLVLCHCVHRRLPDRPALERLRAAVRAGGGQVLDVGDLCAAAALAEGQVRAALAGPGTIVAGCHGRALRALVLRLLGDERPGLRFLDLREAGAPDPLAELGLVEAPAGEAPPAAVPAVAPDAWYPLIDAERCTNCGVCRDFCLFGVYAREAGGAVSVRQPLNCKLDCPACARVCPENAIVFPKCADPAINGAQCSAEQLRGARIRLSPDEVFGGDLKARLAARRASAGRPLLRAGVFGPPPEAPPAGGPQP
jgi:NAD-dependent dihydropyrimidine dehydrogenase PreA subunit